MYFDAAETILDEEVKARLGMESRFDEPSTGAPRVKRTGTALRTPERARPDKRFVAVAALSDVSRGMPGPRAREKATFCRAALET